VKLTQPELEAWGERLGAMIEPPLLIALRGDLGAGKSVLARAIARGAGVTAVMPSPTYTLVHRYSGTRATIVHLDLYRLERSDEVWELGWRELGADREIVIVEWPERAEALLPPDRWEIVLEVETETVRRVGAMHCGRTAPVPGVGT
jgi:tRNA threonylcarbamoyladenosine biosynthesis protein TsaE